MSTEAMILAILFTAYIAINLILAVTYEDEPHVQKLTKVVVRR